MLIKAEQKFTRQTPTRLRLVAAAVKSLSPKVALDQLKFMDAKAAHVMFQVMKQAVANATNNLGLSVDALTIKEIVVGEGPQYKRFQPVSRGRAHSILKRTSHVRVVLESKETSVVKKKVDAPKTVNAEEVKVQGDTKTQVSKFTPVLAERKQVGKSQTTVRTAAVRKTGER